MILFLSEFSSEFLGRYAIFGVGKDSNRGRGIVATHIDNGRECPT